MQNVLDIFESILLGLYPQNENLGLYPQNENQVGT